MRLRTVMPNEQTLHTRPSCSRPAQRESWYSRAHGISAHQLLTPDFLKIFHKLMMKSALRMTSGMLFSPRKSIKRTLITFMACSLSTIFLSYASPSCSFLNFADLLSRSANDSSVGMSFMPDSR